MKTYLLSIKEEPFNGLLNGTKPFEFRKIFPEIASEFRIIFYVSAPIKAICGVGRFGPPIKGLRSKMIQLAKSRNYGNFKSVAYYFKKHKKGFALPLISIKKLSISIELDALRKLVPGFQPPQSYMSLDDSRYSLIQKEVFG